MSDQVTALQSAHLLAAPISGFPALVVAASLDEKCAAYRLKVAAGQLDPRLLAELERARDAAHQAAEAWRIHRAEQARRESEIVVDAIAAADLTTAAAQSPQEVSTDAAAHRLGVGANRVRQLLRSGDLGGRRVGRTWLVSMSALRELEGLRADGRIRRAA